MKERIIEVLVHSVADIAHILPLLKKGSFAYIRLLEIHRTLRAVIRHLEEEEQ